MPLDLDIISKRYKKSSRRRLKIDRTKDDIVRRRKIKSIDQVITVLNENNQKENSRLIDNED